MRFQLKHISYHDLIRGTMNTYTAVNTEPVIKILASTMLMPTLITFDSLRACLHELRKLVAISKHVKKNHRYIAPQTREIK